jgi:hypothetical protein
LTSLFGITARKDVTTSQLSVDESSSSESNKISIAAPIDVAKEKEPKTSSFFKTSAKPMPSFEREMNFWSPTST